MSNWTSDDNERSGKIEWVTPVRITIPLGTNVAKSGSVADFGSDRFNP